MQASGCVYRQSGVRVEQQLLLLRLVLLLLLLLSVFDCDHPIHVLC